MKKKSSAPVSRKTKVARLIFALVAIAVIVNRATKIASVHPLKSARSELLQHYALSASYIEHYVFKNNQYYACLTTDGVVVNYYDSDLENFEYVKEWLKQTVHSYENGDRSEKAVVAACFYRGHTLGYNIVDDYNDGTKLYLALCYTYYTNANQFTQEQLTAMHDQVLVCTEWLSTPPLRRYFLD